MPSSSHTKSCTQIPNFGKEQDVELTSPLSHSDKQEVLRRVEHALRDLYQSDTANAGLVLPTFRGAIESFLKEEKGACLTPHNASIIADDIHEIYVMWREKHEDKFLRAVKD